MHGVIPIPGRHLEAGGMKKVIVELRAVVDVEGDQLPSLLHDDITAGGVIMVGPRGPRHHAKRRRTQQSTHLDAIERRVLVATRILRRKHIASLVQARVPRHPGIQQKRRHNLRERVVQHLQVAEESRVSHPGETGPQAMLGEPRRAFLVAVLARNGVQPPGIRPRQPRDGVGKERGVGGVQQRGRGPKPGFDAEAIGRRTACVIVFNRNVQVPFLRRGCLDGDATDGTQESLRLLMGEGPTSVRRM